MCLQIDHFWWLIIFRLRKAKKERWTLIDQIEGGTQCLLLWQDKFAAFYHVDHFDLEAFLSIVNSQFWFISVFIFCYLFMCFSFSLSFWYLFAKCLDVSVFYRYGTCYTRLPQYWNHVLFVLDVMYMCECVMYQNLVLDRNISSCLTYHNSIISLKTYQIL